MAAKDRMAVLTQMMDQGVIPVFYHPDVEVCKKVIQACADGGGEGRRVHQPRRHRRQVFLDVVPPLREADPTVILGVGSVVDAATAGIYIANGANFVVGPLLNPEVARLCNRRKIAYFPGCGSASEISARRGAGRGDRQGLPRRLGGRSRLRQGHPRARAPGRASCPPAAWRPREDASRAWFKAGVACVGIGSNLITKALLVTPATRASRRTSARVAITRRSSRKRDGHGHDTLKIRPPQRDAAGTPSPSVKSCSASIPARAASAPRAPSASGKAAANTTSPAACASAAGKRAAVVTAFADNEVGRLIEDLILQGGVDLSHVKWRPFDGIGRNVRVGLNFTERGFGIRGAVGCSDRGHSAASQLKPGDVDWEKIFGKDGVRWFHTGGIFAALSETTADVVDRGRAAASKHGTDRLLRPQLPRLALEERMAARRGPQEVNRDIANHVDVMIGNEEDFTAVPRLRGRGAGRAHLRDRPRQLQEDDRHWPSTEFPNFKVVATTLRNAKTATVNDWGAIVWAGGDSHEAPCARTWKFYDRVGGGDSFASGLVYGFMEGKATAEGGRLRRRPRRPGHDDPRRHVDGVPPGGRGRHEVQGRARHPLGKEHSHVLRRFAATSLPGASRSSPAARAASVRRSPRRSPRWAQ